MNRIQLAITITGGLFNIRRYYLTLCIYVRIIFLWCGTLASSFYSRLAKSNTNKEKQLHPRKRLFTSGSLRKVPKDFHHRDGVLSLPELLYSLRKRYSFQ